MCLQILKSCSRISASLHNCFYCPKLPEGLRRPHPFLPAGAWYDLRLILGEDRTVIMEYKNVKMSNWIAVGALAVHDDFRPNYVAISAERGGRMDDVGYKKARNGAPPFAP